MSAGAPLSAGVDVGTQSVRMALLEEDGRVAATGSSPLSSTVSGGERHEQSPESWWQALCEASQQATGAVRGRAVSGLAICSTSGTVLLADAAGEPLTPALMYDDSRATREARLAQEAGEEVWSASGYRMSGSFALPRLLWLLRHGYGEGAARLMHSADYVASRLAGHPVATDWSHALKTGYDLAGERWPLEVLERLEIPAGLLPEVVRSGTRIGEISASTAEHTGLPAGTSVRAGMTDGCAAQISAGALEEGRWNSVLGTTLVLKGATRALLHDPNGALYSHRHPDSGWLPGGASNVGAGILATDFPDRDLARLDAEAERRGPATTAVYPLAAEGERFPFSDSEARGFWLGEPEDEADRYRAVLEGVAFVERLCFAHVESLGARVHGPVSVTGGGAKSSLWCQIRADVLGRPVVVPRSAEAAPGMAILASAGTGSVTEAASRMAGVSATFEPHPESAERLAENLGHLLTAFVERGYISEELAGEGRH